MLKGEIERERNVYRLQLGMGRLCDALRLIAGSCEDAPTVARKALNHKEPDPDWTAPMSDKIEGLPDDDEPKTYRELAEAAILDMRAYADDELPHRRMVSVEGYEERLELLDRLAALRSTGSAPKPDQSVERLIAHARKIREELMNDLPNGVGNTIDALCAALSASPAQSQDAGSAEGEGDRIERLKAKETRQKLRSMLECDAEGEGDMVERLVLALEPLANLAGSPAVNFNDPLRKWFTVAQLHEAKEAIDAAILVMGGDGGRCD